MRITGRKEVSYEKKQRNRRWFSLLLGICLLVSMQLSAFAESQSAEGIPEAVTTGSGQLQEQSGKAEEQSAGNGQIQAEERSAGNGQIQAEERSAGNGQIQAEERSAGNGQIQAEEQTAENRQTMAEQQERAVSGKIEAKVYLRYSNEVPSAINNAFAMGEFGPSGNDKPYFTVTVDLDELNKKVNSYSYWQDYGRGNWVEYIYYSIDSDARWNQQNTRLESVTKLWREAITSAMSAADQAKFTNVFGENMFVGYVLKREGSGWHIDGVLAEDPPVYVVELYDAENNGLFAISSNDTKLPGVTYREFKRKAEEILGGQNYQYEEENDHIIMTYQKDGVTYQTEIVPKSDGADASYVKNYHVYPAQGKFAYRTVTADTYYLCRLKMTTRQVGTDLWIEKKVAGGAADPKEHFTFVLTKTSLAGTSYSVSYEGIAENDGAGHQETLTFDGNGVARLSLKNGEKARILQMPSGDVQIKEENGDYVTKVTVNGISEKYSDASGIKIQLSSEKTELVFTNQLDAQPPTGAELLSVPYWLMGGTALAGLLGSRITGKRRKDRKKKFF